jgi:hypothetical protein
LDGLSEAEMRGYGFGREAWEKHGPPVVAGERFVGGVAAGHASHASTSTAATWLLPVIMGRGRPADGNDPDQRLTGRVRRHGEGRQLKRWACSSRSGIFLLTPDRRRDAIS